MTRAAAVSPACPSGPARTAGDRRWRTPPIGRDRHRQAVLIRTLEREWAAAWAAITKRCQATVCGVETPAHRAGAAAVPLSQDAGPVPVPDEVRANQVRVSSAGRTRVSSAVPGSSGKNRSAFQLR